MDEYIIDTFDRISPLPDFIVHHILSFLDSYTDLVRISVLSKRWFTLWATFPILDFDVSKMVKALKEIRRKKMGMPSHIRCIGYDLVDPAREKLIKYVSYTLSRFSEHNVTVHKFNLDVRLEESIEVTYFDRWVSLAVEKEVQVLDLCAWAPFRVNKRCLPKTLLSARSLTSLAICYCDLPSSLLVDIVKFKSLKSLSLTTIDIDERVIECFTTMCPLIEEFKVFRCTVFKGFCVSGLQNLQRITSIVGNEVETIDIKAPNLSYLSVTISDALGEITRSINLFS